MDKIADDVDIRWLITEFSDYSKAIATIVDMEQVIKDTPFWGRFYTSLSKKV
jgi:hypothetical protein